MEISFLIYMLDKNGVILSLSYNVHTKGAFI